MARSDIYYIKDIYGMYDEKIIYAKIMKRLSECAAACPDDPAAPDLSKMSSHGFTEGELASLGACCLPYGHGGLSREFSFLKTRLGLRRGQIKVFAVNDAGYSGGFVALVMPASERSVYGAVADYMSVFGFGGGRDDSGFDSPLSLIYTDPRRNVSAMAMRKKDRVRERDGRMMLAASDLRVNHTFLRDIADTPKSFLGVYPDEGDNAILLDFPCDTGAEKLYVNALASYLGKIFVMPGISDYTTYRIAEEVARICHMALSLKDFDEECYMMR